MSSERQIIANRINGAKSHGPITPEGRLASSRNSITQNGEPVRPCPRNAETAGSTSGQHGLLSEAVILQGESAERFNDLHDSLIEEFQPETPTEVGLVETMVVCRWRLMRIWILENSAVAHEIRKQAVANELGNKPTQAALAYRTLTDDLVRPYPNTRHLTGLAPSRCGYQPRFPVKTDAADSRMYCSVSLGDECCWPYPHNRLVEDEATGQRYETRYDQLSRAIQRFNEVRAHREKKLFSTNEPNLDGSL